MRQYASIKVRPKTEQKPSVRTLAHNQRIAKNIDLLPMEHRLENYHMNKLSNLTKTFNDWKLENEERYQKINGRKLRSDAHRLESLAIILSGDQVAKCSPDEIWKKAEDFKNHFEEKYKTKVRTMDWHRDEGHIENGIVIRNDHIHLEYDNVNEDGKMVRKLFSKGDLIKFQDKIAEIYEPLGFKRGENTAKKSPSDTPKRGIPQKQWKTQKIKSASSKSMAKQKDLKAEIATLKEQLQEQGAKREDYAKLEQFNKELKEQIKNKDLTIEELEEKIKNFPSIAEHENMMIENDALYEKLEVKNEQISKLNKDIDFKGQRIRETRLENTTLKNENTDLKAKLATLPSETTSSELKSLTSDFEQKLQAKDEHIEKLEDGYKQICKSIGIDTDKIEIKDINFIVKTVNAMTTIIDNVSKYIGIAEEKLISLFSKEKLPKSHEVEELKEKKENEIVLPKSNYRQNSSIKIKP